MTHALEGRLQAYVDDELTAAEIEDLERHLERCDRCSAELNGLRALSESFTTAMQELDQAPRLVSAPLQPPPSSRQPLRRSVRRALPRAAVLLLVAAAVASATLPGSPVHEWIRELVAPAPPRAAETPPGAPAETAPVAEVEAPSETGVAILPRNGLVSVVIVGADSSLRLHAMLSDSEQAEVVALGEASQASFVTAPGRIEVRGAGSGELRIKLPRSVLHATVEVNGVPYLATNGERLQLFAPALDSAAEGVLFRVRP